MIENSLSKFALALWIFLLSWIFQPIWGNASEGSNHLPLEPFQQQWDFENNDPFVKWASDGKYKLHSKGITSEKASSGQKSFKLKLTFDTASYVYFSIPVTIPNYGKLNFKGDIWVLGEAGTKATLGTNTSFTPWRMSGVNILGTQTGEADKWLTQRSDLIDAGQGKAENAIYKHLAGATPQDVGTWTDRIGLFLFGKPDTTMIVYVDNISISGLVPTEKNYLQYLSKKWFNYKNRHKALLSEVLNQIGNYKISEVIKIKAQSIVKGYVSKQDFKTLESLAEEKKYLPLNASDEDLTVFSWNPTSQYRITPFTYPIPATQTNNIHIDTTPNEYEPASFVLRAQKDIQNVSITLSDLSGPDGAVLSSENFDVKWVKCWYQAGWDDLRVRKGEKFLTPELLVKNDKLIRVDHKTKSNFLQVATNGHQYYTDISNINSVFPQNATIHDADRLSPVDLKKNTNKQVWITAKVPPASSPGKYSGKIIIKGNNIQSKTLNFTIEIFPFLLPPSPLEYSIYYGAKLVDKSMSDIGSHLKSAQQYRIEMKDLKEHGIESATLYQRLDKKLSEALLIRNESGMNNGKLYVINFGLISGEHIDLKGQNKLRETVLKWVDTAQKNKYKDVFIYGIDEANNSLISSQLKEWQIVHSSGAGIFVACPKTAYKVSNGLLDIGVLYGQLNSQIAMEWQKKGLKIFSYSNPQVGVENPGVYRKNYGLELWLAGYDGAMDFAYQYEMGHIWNDFDHVKYRDHVFTYPATDSLIDTIQWQGFREAVDDTRYLNLLLINNVYTKERLKKWLKEELQKNAQPEKLREIIVEKLLTLERGIQ